MFELKGTKIRHTRGDTGVLRFIPQVDGHDLEEYTAVLSVKQSPNAKQYALQKECVDGKFVFVHEDTNELKPGGYVWDVEVRTLGGQYYTVGPYQYIVLADVTR